MSNDLKSAIKARVNKYKNFHGFKNKSEAELYRMAEENIKMEMLLKDLNVEDQFDIESEKTEASEIATKYLKDYTFEFISDKNNLKQLIYLEMINKRIQKTLNKFYKDSDSTPPILMESLHKNVTQINTLKEKLGLNRNLGSEGNKGWLEHIELLKKKFKQWMFDNQASRTCCCPHCSQMFLLRMRTDAWEAQKHPYFKDRLLYNEHLVKLYKQGKITKEDVSNILQTSVDYADWLIEKFRSNEQITAEDAVISDKNNT